MPKLSTEICDLARYFEFGGPANIYAKLLMKAECTDILIASLKTESQAVFLSYASQDAGAARRIQRTLQENGIEVWLDQSDLRGGDIWDQTIRRQIKECRLFLPLISRNSTSRGEGYFRLEWKLAVDRSHLMAPDQPFIVPVTIDEMPPTDTRVPERFYDYHWSRLADGETNAGFVERIAVLLGRAASTPSQVVPNSSPDSEPAAVNSPVKPPIQRLIPRLFALTAIVATGIFLTWFAEQRHNSHSQLDSLPQVVDTPRSGPEKSIAVLPFLDLSEKKDQEYFSDGISEELIDLLARIPQLRVPARTSSFYFKNKSEDVAVIAQKLRVANVLEGSVRRTAGTIRVTAQLIQANSGYHLWSGTYDRDIKDILKVQDEIAGAVVDALKLKLTPESPRTNSHQTIIPEAYNQYLLGRQFLDRGNSDDYERSIRALNNAIALEPGYASAYSELAIAEFFVAKDRAGYERALAAAGQAVSLDPDNANGYAVRGYQRAIISWEWQGAEEDVEKALILGTGDGAAQRRAAGLLSCLGKWPEAIRAATRATELDPLSSFAWKVLGDVLTSTRQFVQAEAAYTRALDIEPDSKFAKENLVYLRLFDGHAHEAMDFFRKSDTRIGLAMAAYTIGQEKEAQDPLSATIIRNARDFPVAIAGVYAWRGEASKAFEWLDKAYNQKDVELGYIKAHLEFDPLRADARYKALLRKMNLPL